MVSIFCFHISTVWSLKYFRSVTNNLDENNACMGSIWVRPVFQNDYFFIYEMWYKLYFASACKIQGLQLNHLQRNVISVIAMLMYTYLHTRTQLNENLAWRFARIPRGQFSGTDIMNCTYNKNTCIRKSTSVEVRQSWHYDGIQERR